MPDLIIKKIPRWQTSDGVEHTTHEMAVRYVINAELLERLVESGMSPDRHHAQDVLNALSDKTTRAKLREWVDACDAMEKAAMEGSTHG